MMRRHLIKLMCLIWVWAISACTFNFEVTGQRTALENQVMGSYKELDDDLILASSVRGPQANLGNPSTGKKKAVDARLNQQFNQDDLGELADLGIVGEAGNGTVALVPISLSRRTAPTAEQLQLAKQIITEENRDRATIWQRIIAANPNLDAKDLPEVQKTYAKMRRQSLAIGQWYQDDGGRWQQKQTTAGSGS